MIPGMNLNSRQMKQMMKKMGMEQETLDAEQVIIKLADKEIIFNNPEVAEVNMMGQNTFQITGDYEIRDRETTPDIEEEDITTVMEQTHSSREEAIEAINDANGDLAEAILSLQSTADDIGEE